MRPFTIDLVHALPRTAPHVTVAASALRLAAAMQPPRRAQRSLSVKSLGDFERAVKLTYYLFFCFAASIACGSEPPAGWKKTLTPLEDPKHLWEACSDGDRFYASRLIGLFRTFGSQHDGDRQYDVADLLAHVADDPYAGLKHYLASPDPYDRAFVVHVIGYLGDRRFLPALEALTKDTASIKRWDLLPYESVGGGARSAMDQIRRRDSLVNPDGPLPKWLQAARHSKAK